VVAGPVILHYLSKDMDAKTTVSCVGIEIFNCDRHQYLNFDLSDINKRLIVPKFRCNLVYGQHGNRTEATLNSEDITFKITPSNYIGFSKLNQDQAIILQKTKFLKMSRPEHLMNLLDYGEYLFKFDFQLPQIQFILVSEAFQSFIPFLKFDIFTEKLSMFSQSLFDMEIKSDFLMYATYYNNKIGIWEPLMEQFDMTMHYVYANKHVGIKIQPKDDVYNALKFNITPEFIKLLSKVYYFFDQMEGDEKKSAKNSQFLKSSSRS
jgi:hypothetical protein